MFMIYHSNCPELFMRLLINVMSSNRLSNPMQSEIILTEHKIMEKWIEIELTNYFSIAANIMFMNIMSFIQKISSDILDDHVDTYNFSRGFMYWKFMEILPKVGVDKDCVIIQRYLQYDINQQKCGQLSEQLSNLFSEYLIYRPDWLDIWKSDKIIDNLNIEHQMWQSKIWRMFLRYTKNSLQEINFLNRCISFLQKNTKTTNYNIFPKRIFIFGVTSIPPIYWKILKLLSYHVDIYLWVINPCMNNWNHIVNCNSFHINQKKSQQSLNNRSSYESSISFDKQHNNHNYHYYNNCSNFNNSLLDSWGNIGQDTLCLLDQLGRVFKIRAFTVPKKDSMLHILQKNILESQHDEILDSKNNQTNFMIVKNNNKKNLLKYEDRSITIHICHNIQREIEILHDNLLLMLSNDSSLLPGEIIVMAPDIHYYVSAIKTTFNNIFNRKLPFAISSKNESYIHPIISSVLSILNIPYSRFTAEEILSFLSVSSIASRFNINTEEVKLLKKLIIESGIRWGLDNNTMNNFDLPVIDQNTWYFGLRRILLGYAMNSQNGLWENVLPYDYINEEYINITSRLGEFLKILRKWRDRLHYSYTLHEWMPVIQEIFNDFFNCSNLNSEESKILFLLKTTWIDILQSGIQIGYSKKINIIILRDKLKIKLNRKKINYQFLPNVINFYDITPICYIPCKVLCFIGMNNDAFPRHVSLCNFNLILKKPRFGDNNIRKKDYYAFLLACLLPKKQMYISFIRKSVYYNDIIDYPSVLINELLEYFAQNFYLIGDQDLSTVDNVERIRQHLFQRHSCMPFDPNNFINHNQTQSFAKEWLKPASIKMNCNVSMHFNFITSLPKIIVTKISFHDLYNFYKHPIRTWFQKRLGVYFYQNTYKQLINNEPFFVDDLYRFQLNTKLVNYLIRDLNINELYLESFASGMLPYGPFGKSYWFKQCLQMNELANQIKMYYSSEVYNLSISLKFSTIRLVGQLSAVQKDGLVRWKPSNLSMKDCFLLWLEHLIYCSLGGRGDSRLFGIKNTIWHFPNFSKSQAQELLFPLISGYCTGMNIPLMLLYQSGGVWMNYIFDWNNKIIHSTQIYQKKARQKLIDTWQGNNIRYSFSIRENHDPYLRKLIPFDLDEEDIKKITNTAQHYFFHVMKYRIL